MNDRRIGGSRSEDLSESEDRRQSEDLVALPWWSKWALRVGLGALVVVVVVDLVQLVGR